MRKLFHLFAAALFVLHTAAPAHADNEAPYLPEIDARFRVIEGGVGQSGVPTTRRVDTTSPLTGGGSLAANRTIALPQADAVTDGYLAAGDFTTFNNKVATTRTISTTGPLTGGGDLSTNRTFAIPMSSTSVDGYLASTDFVTFNNKVSGSRQVLTTSPLSGGGPLSGDVTLAISKATAGVDGYLAAADFTTFNGKQAAISGNTCSANQYAVSINSAGAVGCSAITAQSPVQATSTISSTDIGWNLASVFKKTLTGSTSFTMSQVKDGQTLIAEISNTVGNNYTAAFTWSGGTIYWPNNTAPTQSTGAHTDLYTFVCTGASTIRATVIQNYN